MKPRRSTQTFLGALALVCLLTGLPAPALAQIGGDLPQEAQKGIQASILRLESQGAMATRAGLEELIGPRKLAAFLDGAVAKLTIMPDGTFEAMSREGGDIVSFDLGKTTIATPDEAVVEAGWRRKTGRLVLAKRQQKLALSLRAGTREVTVACYNKYRKSKEPITFYVGPLDGLFCMGLSNLG